VSVVTFSELLEDAFLDPDSVDYDQLRTLYVHSSCYIPFGRDQSSIETLNTQLAAMDFEAAIHTIEPLIEVDPLSITLRLAYAHALDGIEDEWEASTQRAVANGLIKAILGSGDGRSPQTAIVVLDDRERELVLQLLSVKPASSQMTTTEDGWLDCVTCHQGRLVYLDVSWPQGWLLAMNAN
jgi:hypothetical protein